MQCGETEKAAAGSDREGEREKPWERKEQKRTTEGRGGAGVRGGGGGREKGGERGRERKRARGLKAEEVWVGSRVYA